VLEFDACVGGSEVPVGLGVVGLTIRSVEELGSRMPTSITSKTAWRRRAIVQECLTAMQSRCFDPLVGRLNTGGHCWTLQVGGPGFVHATSPADMVSGEAQCPNLLIFQTSTSARPS
jgi:hypothetical protein